MDDDALIDQALAEAGADDQDEVVIDQQADELPEETSDEAIVPDDPAEEPDEEEAASGLDEADPAENQVQDDPKTALDDHDYNLLAAETGLHPDGVKSWLSAVGQLSESGITPDQIGDAAKLAYLEQTDPEAALGILREKMYQIGLEVGVFLSPELQQMVDTGKLTKSEAQHFAQQQARQQQQQRSMQQKLARYEQQQRQSSVAAITQWHQSLKASPDFTPALERTLAAEIALQKAEGRMPQDPGQIMMWLDQIAADIMPARPVRKATSPQPRSTGSGGASKPASLIDQALAEAGAL